MGRPRKIVVEQAEELKGREAVTLAVATVLQERCGISGCLPKLHLEEAQFLMRKFIAYGIITERD